MRLGEESVFAISCDEEYDLAALCGYSSAKLGACGGAPHYLILFSLAGVFYPRSPSGLSKHR